MMNNRQKIGAVIVAAGSSQRMGGIDKIFVLLDGRPALSRVVDTFQKCNLIDQIVIVLNGQNLERGKRMVARNGWSKVVSVCSGGERRQDSVIVGLDRLSRCEWVVIHDGARPLVTDELIQCGLETAEETGAAISAVPVIDTIKVAGDDHIVQGTPPRKSLWAVQTPQVFRFDIIAEAYRQLKYEVTDDARAVEHLGGRVKLYMGSYDNIKITTPDDLALARILIRKYGK